MRGRASRRTYDVNIRIASHHTSRTTTSGRAGWPPGSSSTAGSPHHDEPERRCCRVDDALLTAMVVWVGGHQRGRAPERVVWFETGTV